MSDEAFALFDRYLSGWVNQVLEGQNVFAHVAETNIEEIYTLAYMLYRDRKYAEASYFFRLLIMARPSVIKFWKGFGACLQMQKEYEGALNCYLCCSQLENPDSLDPYLYVQAADCYFALKQVNEGLKALEAAYVRAKKINNLPILKHVAFMRQQWLKSS